MNTRSNTSGAGRGGDDPVIGLDVGGQLFYTHKSTLTAGSAYFAARFGGSFSAGRSYVDERGRDVYFVDADGGLFEHVLRYLRRGIPTWAKNDDVLIQQLVGEAEYFGVVPMVDDLLRVASIPPNSRTSKEFATITGAGLAEANGLYHLTNEICDGLPVYRMQVTWRGRPRSYCLFRCRLSNGEKKWFISYVPKGVKPGTTKDVDFYAAADPVAHYDFPPEHGWICSNEGVDPAPTLRRHGRDIADDELYGDAMDE